MSGEITLVSLASIRAVTISWIVSVLSGRVNSTEPAPSGWPECRGALGRDGPVCVPPGNALEHPLQKFLIGPLCVEKKAVAGGALILEDCGGPACDEVADFKGGPVAAVLGRKRGVDREPVMVPGLGRRGDDLPSRRRRTWLRTWRASQAALQKSRY